MSPVVLAIVTQEAHGSAGVMYLAVQIYLQRNLFTNDCRVKSIGTAGSEGFHFLSPR